MYKLKFQERKFNQSKETPEDFLIDLTRLSNVAFANSGGNDYSAERTRRNRDAFTTAIPTHISIKLLMQPDTTTVTDLCSSVSKSLVLKSILPDEEASTTGFNAITQGPTSTNLAAAINGMTRANENLAAGQRDLSKQMNRMSLNLNNRRFNNSNNRGRYQRGRYSFFQPFSRQSFQNQQQQYSGSYYQPVFQNQQQLNSGNYYQPRFRGGFLNRRPGFRFNTPITCLSHMWTARAPPE